MHANDPTDPSEREAYWPGFRTAVSSRDKQAVILDVLYQASLAGRMFDAAKISMMAGVSELETKGLLLSLEEEEMVQSALPPSFRVRIWCLSEEEFQSRRKESEKARALHLAQILLARECQHDELLELSFGGSVYEDDKTTEERLRWYRKADEKQKEIDSIKARIEEENLTVEVMALKETLDPEETVQLIVARDAGLDV